MEDGRETRDASSFVNRLFVHHFSFVTETVLFSARFGPAGGLSQPRRDTADPRVIDYLLFSIEYWLFAASQVNIQS